ncbi:hypothetical protein SCALM49S_01805 [Streptomyces californicus]
MSCQPRGGGAPDDLDDRVAVVLLRDEPVAVVEQLVVALGPVLGERGGQSVDGGPGDLDVGVPPLALVAGVAAPLLGYPDTAGERGLLVDDEDLAVAAVVLRSSGER